MAVPVVAALAHRCVELAADRVGVRLPLGRALGELTGESEFLLTEDPREVEHAVVMGVTVVRPAHSAPPGGLRAADMAAWLSAVPDWCHDYDGHEGGSFIAAGSAFDAFRLALHYGVADAILVGSGTVAAEGLDRSGRPGYLWGPQTPCAWPQLYGVCPELIELLDDVRRRWQQLGVLSARRRPAQIVISRGLSEEPPGWLQARVLQAASEEGDHEVHILTSDEGAERLRHHGRAIGLGDHIDAMLLPMSADGDPRAIDARAAVRVLRSRLDIRLANHDGGRASLEQFIAQDALAQLNLTLMAQPSLRERVRRTTSGLAGAYVESSARRFFPEGRTLRDVHPRMALYQARENAWLACLDTRCDEQDQAAK